MIKCTHCMRYFLENLAVSLEKGYIRCPYCGELIAVHGKLLKNAEQEKLA
ncbi:hypothetical protein Ami103574_15065 [Aminipila butyrica]|uniref:Uncharacterized protein n=1 Tax=Aminipila butyrica TaxID=433296 RepID=A0A858BWR7_9FIRM|nr:hypothetical protein [Aminipila butyrica]QIB70531.1 hypothetical protein Ami103574_15065 [Aminipila butyrica]